MLRDTIQVLVRRDHFTPVKNGRAALRTAGIARL